MHNLSDSDYVAKILARIEAGMYKQTLAFPHTAHWSALQKTKLSRDEVHNLRRQGGFEETIFPVASSAHDLDE
jgi:hypothetical protein